MHVSAVIGASYGDEGKGHVVDYLSNEKTLVVRYNGGAQAGHTVQTSDGRRHVFHHVGAGAFSGAGTFLSRFFLANPVIFAEEHRRLGHLGVSPKVFIDPASRVTTPWDMIVNQVVERARGQGRHGSCGLGINETVTRDSNGCRLVVSDLLDHQVYRKLESVKEYARSRLTMESLTVPAVFDAAQVTEHFLEDILYLTSNAEVVHWGHQLWGKYDRTVFEGAQGLRLDENGKDFPHVTCSKTGIKNAMTLAREAQFEELSAYYVTRPYLTRHGAGPLSHELGHPPYQNVVDQTNIRNEFQGSLRFAWLDLVEFGEELRKDTTSVLARQVGLSGNLAVTCLDHLDDGTVTWAEGGNLTSGSSSAFLRALEELTLLKVALTCHGPTKLDVQTR